MATATYDIEVFSEKLNQWQYAHTYRADDDQAGAEGVAASFVANNPHRRIEDVRVTLRAEQSA